ncbi:MAG: hypothetical protein ACK56F_21065 [bacterium]
MWPVTVFRPNISIFLLKSAYCLRITYAYSALRPVTVFGPIKPAVL